MADMTLADFLLARVAEDEAAAERGGPHNGGGTFANDNYGCLLIQPDRVLADCEARRRIVGLHVPRVVDAPSDDGADQWVALSFPADIDGCVRCIQGGAPCQTLRLLALPFADHPDYREDEWRP